MSSIRVSQRKKDSKTKKKGEESRNYLVSMVSSAFIVIPLTRWLAPGLIPMTASDVWSSHGTGLMDWLTLGWPILLWGIGVNVVYFFWRHSDPMARYRIERQDPVGIFFGGALISLWAGVVEELAFRWLIFFGSFAGIALTNYFIFGCLGFGIYEWMHLNIWGPLVNFTTFGYLGPQIYSAIPGSETSWILGAAMLTTNAFFRDGHRYQGPFGYVNSWFIGMFFFYVMFHCGLGAAMFLHFSYDMVIFATGAALHAYAQQIPRSR